MDMLTDDFIDELLKPEERSSNQKGPARWFDKEMRCGMRGCSSPTYLKIQGIPRCMKHAIGELNDMLVEAGFQGVV